MAKVEIASFFMKMAAGNAAPNPVQEQKTASRHTISMQVAESGYKRVDLDITAVKSDLYIKTHGSLQLQINTSAKNTVKKGDKEFSWMISAGETMVFSFRAYASTVGRPTTLVLTAPRTPHAKETTITAWNI